MRAVAAVERRPEGRRRAVIGESTSNAARRAVIPCADNQEAGICSRLRRVRAAERRKEHGTVVSPAQRTAAAAERG